MRRVLFPCLPVPLKPSVALKGLRMSQAEEGGWGVRLSKEESSGYYIGWDERVLADLD